MSRDYGTYPRFGLRKRTRIRVNRPGCGIYVVSAIFILALLFFWVTRATSNFEEFVPQESTYEIYGADMLQTAQRVAGSKVWDIIPDERPEYNLRYILAGKLPLPEWLIRNFFYGFCHISGNDTAGFADAVVVTNITRVGNLAERLHFLIPLIDGDDAGGLRLRKVGDTGVYYAVRGRILLISPSRGALIRALTLEPSLHANAGQLAQMQSALQGADFAARLRNANGETPQGALSPIFENFEEVNFSLLAESNSLRLSTTATLNEKVREQYQDILSGINPQPLKQLPDSMLGISWDFATPLPAFFTQVNGAFGNPIDLDALWGAPPSDVEAVKGETPGIASILSNIFGTLGGGGRIMLRSVDQNEMLPAPELVGLFEADTERLQGILTGLEPWLEGDGALTYAPFYDAETRTMRMPLVGGPAMEITAALYGGEALLGTSRPASLALMATPPLIETLANPANLYVLAKPAPLMLEFTKAGAQLAEAGLLRGQTPESFATATQFWQGRADKIESLAGRAAYENANLNIELKITMRE